MCNCTSQVDGINEPNIIAEHFALHFEKICSNNTVEGAVRLKSEYFSKRLGYKGQPHSEKYTFDAELVENAIGNMKRGKAPGLDGITCEHLLFSHALLPSILAKLFNFMIVTIGIFRLALTSLIVCRYRRVVVIYMARRLL